MKEPAENVRADPTCEGDTDCCSVDGVAAVAEFSNVFKMMYAVQEWYR